MGEKLEEYRIDSFKLGRTIFWRVKCEDRAPKFFATKDEAEHYIALELFREGRS